MLCSVLKGTPLIFHIKISLLKFASQPVKTVSQRNHHPNHFSYPDDFIQIMEIILNISLKCLLKVPQFNEGAILIRPTISSSFHDITICCWPFFSNSHLMYLLLLTFLYLVFKL